MVEIGKAQLSVAAETATAAVKEAESNSRFRADLACTLVATVFVGVSGLAVYSCVAALHGAQVLGVFSQVITVYIVAAQFAAWGVQFSVLHSISGKSGNPRACSHSLVAGLLTVCVTSVVTAVIVVLAAAPLEALLQSPGIAAGLECIAPALIFFSLNKVLLFSINGTGCMRAFAAFQSLRYALVICTLGTMLATNVDVSLLPACFTVAEVLLFLVISIYVHVRVLALRANGPLGAQIRHHLSFGGRGVLSGALIEANTRTDILLLGLFTTDAVVGVYAFAATVAEGFAQIPNVLRNNLDPVIGRDLANNRPDRVGAMGIRVRRWFVPSMLAVAVVSTMAFPIFAQLATGNAVFVTGWSLFAVLAAGVVVSSAFRPFLGVLLQGGHPGTHTLLVAIVVVCNITLNILLIPPFGPHGAAIATACAFGVECVLLAWFARVRLGVRLC